MNSRCLICTLLLCASFASIVTGVAGEEVELKNLNDLENLIKIAKRYQLPMPADDAELILATKGWSSGEQGIYHPAFLINTDSASDEKTVLIGWSTETVRNHSEFRPGTREYSLTGQESGKDAFIIASREVHVFSTVLQLANRGDRQRAEQLLGQFRVYNSSNAESLLAESIFLHYYEKTKEPEADLTVIHELLTKLKEDYPERFSDNPEDYYAYRRGAFVNDLGVTIAAESPLPLSVEGLLVAWGNSSGKYLHLGIFDSHNVEVARPARAIFDYGLEGVRDLHQLREDRRLTRHVTPAFNNAVERRVRIGQLASGLAEMLSGAYGLDRAVELASDESTDEQQFFENAAVQSKAGSVTKLYEVPLRILAAKYPDSLPRICEKVLEGGEAEVQLFTLAKSIVASQLSSQQKSAAIVKLAEGMPGLGQKRSLLQNLVKVDEAACTTLLLPLLDSLPTDVDSRYWDSEEANFVHVVVQCSNDEVWNKYLVVVKRASIGLRMEMMEAMNYTYIGDKNRRRRIDFLANFLDDSQVRIRSGGGKFEGPCAAFTFPKIEVRNYVAMKIASLLPGKMQRPAKDWTDDQWQEFRSKVQTGIDALDESKGDVDGKAEGSAKKDD